MRYENFDLLLDRFEGGYRARVIRSLAGEDQIAFGQPLFANPLDPQRFGIELFATVFRHGVDNRQGPVAHAPNPHFAT